SGRTGVFGSTTKRFESPMPASVLQSVLESSPPRPSNQQDDKGGAPVKSSAFASATSRFQNPATKDAVPCPGDYEVGRKEEDASNQHIHRQHVYSWFCLGCHDVGQAWRKGRIRVALGSRERFGQEERRDAGTIRVLSERAWMDGHMADGA
ncbi:hypothetical protein AaE_006539, partial [Aphanomyces astaci]